MPISFHAIEVGGSWAYLDSLDGVPLKEGERLEVRWPDGSITTETVGLECSETPFRAGCDGGPLDIAVAFVRRIDRGAETRVMMRDAGLLARRVR